MYGPSGLCAIKIEKLEFTNLPTMSDVWTNWKTLFEVHIREFPDDAHIGYFISHLDKKCKDIYNSIIFDKNPDLNSVLKKFEEYFTLKKNSIYARYKFNSLKQKATQDVKTFISELNKLSSDCKFNEEEQNNLIRDKLIADNMSDDDLRTCLLENPNLNLHRTIEILEKKSKKPVTKKILKPKDSSSTHTVDKKQNQKSSSTQDVYKNKNKNVISRRFTAKEVIYLKDTTKKYKNPSEIDNSVFERIINDPRASFQDCSIKQIKNKVIGIKKKETKPKSQDNKNILIRLPHQFLLKV